MKTQVIKFLASLILFLSITWGSSYIFGAINLPLCDGQWFYIPTIVTFSIVLLSAMVYCIVQLFKIEEGH